ncbi:OmpA family protein, partial [Mesonia sp. K7]|uniref:OmpA family protein n=1 Tax=Mesonia sp. K7 TaxID=2218606 RepID=UPI000DA828A0
AIEDYEKLVSKGKDDAYVHMRLAEAYYNIYNSQNAEKYYGMYIAEVDTATAEAHVRYAEMLKANQKYDQSNQAMDAFANKYPQDVRAREYRNNPNYLDGLLNTETKYTTTVAGNLNTGNSDFGVYEKDEKVYFVSARNEARKNYGWNKQPTLDIYVADKVADDFSKATLLPGEVNTKYHEGTIAISPDGNTMYFTRNDYTDGDYEKSSNGIGQLKLYTAKLVEGVWDDVQEVPFNNSEYSTGHPALSPDGNTLYFSSDMPGGFGMSDLYKVTVNADGTFSEPVNLGGDINTPGKESFPFIDQEGTLYFSSDGHLGLGGLDIFAIDEGKTSLADVTNMGQPINSTADDFAFSYDRTAKMGYVSSNRGSKDVLVANDEIYRVGEVEPELHLIVKVINSENGALIANADVDVYNDAGMKLAGKQTNASGLTDFNLPGKKKYELQVNAEEYESGSASVEEDAGEELTVVVELDPIERMITKEEVILNPILFEFDKATITPEGAMELDRLVAVMKKHENMVIFVRSHTDNRGSDTYNLDLSERRAQSTVQYVISKGIDESRISGQGFGENDPKIKCGSNCTEEEHQTNRRSEFKIVKR